MNTLSALSTAWYSFVQAFVLAVARSELIFSGCFRCSPSSFSMVSTLSVAFLSVSWAFVSRPCRDGLDYVRSVHAMATGGGQDHGLPKNNIKDKYYTESARPAWVPEPLRAAEAAAGPTAAWRSPTWASPTGVRSGRTARPRWCTRVRV